MKKTATVYMWQRNLLIVASDSIDDVDFRALERFGLPTSWEPRLPNESEPSWVQSWHQGFRELARRLGIEVTILHQEPPELEWWKTRREDRFPWMDVRYGHPQFSTGAAADPRFD